MRKSAVFILILCCTLALCGCSRVSQAEYDTLLAQRDQLLEENNTLKSENEAMLSGSTDDCIRSRVSGCFVAQVHCVIPGYVLDGTTPMVAVVTNFQCLPYTLYLGETLVNEVSDGGVYVFEIQETYVDLTPNQLALAPMSPDVAVALFDLRIASITPIEETDYEYGLDSNHLIFESIE